MKKSVEISEEVREDLTIHAVDTIDEVLEFAPDKEKPDEVLECKSGQPKPDAEENLASCTN